VSQPQCPPISGKVSCGLYYRDFVKIEIVQRTSPTVLRKTISASRLLAKASLEAVVEMPYDRPRKGQRIGPLRQARPKQSSGALSDHEPFCIISSAATCWTCVSHFTACFALRSSQNSLGSLTFYN